MNQFKDQLGKQISLPNPPKRIISLVPSQTELLADLGLAEEVVGITKFCVHPTDWYKAKTKIGGTKTLNINKIRSLQPDLIIGNKEENTQEQIETLSAEFPVWMSDIYTLPDALAMIRAVGEICNRSEKAKKMAIEIEQKFANMPKPEKPKRAAYLIWRKPHMAAASQTFIDEMLRLTGFENVFAHLSRYPQIMPADLAAAKPDVILLSSEPYPFKQKHFSEYQEICPSAEIRLVDGELFSWYGSRLMKLG